MRQMFRRLLLRRLMERVERKKGNCGGGGLEEVDLEGAWVYRFMGLWEFALQYQ